MAKLQLALDVLTIDEAVKIAKKAEKYVDIIEAGTPLIKQEGLRAVKILKEKFPSKTILADMKTADTGALEVKMAADAGADITTVLGAAPIETWRNALEEAENRGLLLAVDTIGVGMKAIEKKLKIIRPDMLVVHRGIDEGINKPFKIGKLKVNIPIAVAGGITPETAELLVKKYRRIEVVIVGRYITKARDPAKAAKEIKEVIE